MQAATRGDGVRLQLSGVDVISFRVVGALPGVVVQCVGAANGPGVGRLIASTGSGGIYIAWQAPDSSTPGAPQPVSLADGSYLCEDGEDPTQWIRFQVYNAFLPSGVGGAGESQVYIGDRYNEMGPDDVTAAEALAGQVETVEYTLTNVSPIRVLNVKCWIDRSGVISRGITISQDNITFTNPGSEGAAGVLVWASIEVGASVNVWMQRTISAAATSTPGRLNYLEFGWDGL
jgi:hypothetical protein